MCCYMQKYGAFPFSLFHKKRYCFHIFHNSSYFCIDKDNRNGVCLHLLCRVTGLTANPNKLVKWFAAKTVFP